jgi:hypothetical protein
MPKAFLDSAGHRYRGYFGESHGSGARAPDLRGAGPFQIPELLAVAVLGLPTVCAMLLPGGPRPPRRETRAEPQEGEVMAVGAGKILALWNDLRRRAARSGLWVSPAWVRTVISEAPVCPSLFSASLLLGLACLGCP